MGAHLTAALTPSMPSRPLACMELTANVSEAEPVLSRNGGLSRSTGDSSGRSETWLHLNPSFAPTASEPHLTTNAVTQEFSNRIYNNPPPSQDQPPRSGYSTNEAQHLTPSLTRSDAHSTETQCTEAPPSSPKARFFKFNEQAARNLIAKSKEQLGNTPPKCRQQSVEYFDCSDPSVQHEYVPRETRPALKDEAAQRRAEKAKEFRDWQPGNVCRNARTRDQTSKRWRCPDEEYGCGWSHDKKSDWKRHCRAHWPQQVWICPDLSCCGLKAQEIKAFKSKTALVGHYKSFHEADGQPALEPSQLRRCAEPVLDSRFPRRCHHESCCETFETFEDRLDHFAQCHHNEGKENKEETNEEYMYALSGCNSNVPQVLIPLVQESSIRGL